MDTGSGGSVLVQCNADAAHEQVAITVAGHGVFKTTRAQKYATGGDYVYPYMDRFERIDDTTYVDLADGSEITLPGKHVTGYISRYILIENAAGYAAYDLERHVATPLHSHGTADTEVDRDIVTIGGVLWDLRTGKQVTDKIDRIAFISTSDHVLRFARENGRGEAPSGPLRWDP